MRVRVCCQRESVSLFACACVFQQHVIHINETRQRVCLLCLRNSFELCFVWVCVYLNLEAWQDSSHKQTYALLCISSQGTGLYHTHTVSACSCLMWFCSRCGWALSSLKGRAQLLLACHTLSSPRISLEERKWLLRRENNITVGCWQVVQIQTLWDLKQTGINQNRLDS